MEQYKHRDAHVSVARLARSEMHVGETCPYLSDLLVLATQSGVQVMKHGNVAAGTHRRPISAHRPHPCSSHDPCDRNGSLDCQSLCGPLNPFHGTS